MELLRDNRNWLLFGGCLITMTLICGCASIFAILIFMNGEDQTQIAAQPPTTFVIATTAAPVNTSTATQQPTMTPTTRSSSGTTSNTSGNVTPCTVRTDWLLYTVVAGDTLGTLAQRTGSTINALTAGNCLSNPDSIRVGQQLRVPVAPIPPTVPPTVASTNPQIALNPSFGTVGTPVMVNISGFPVNVPVEIHLGLGPNLFSSQIFASGTTNSSGSANISFNMPSEWTSGEPITSDINVLAVQRDYPYTGKYTLFTWSMIRQIMYINPAQVTAGTPITVALDGFPAFKEVRIHLGRSERDYDTTALLTVTTNATGAATIQFNFPDHWQDNTPITINYPYLVAVTTDSRYSVATTVMYTPIVQTIQ